MVNILLEDVKENFEKFLELIDPHIKAGKVTLEKADIKFYRADKK